MNNNNRGNNNRRRGRGNNRQQGGGGQQLNRIDSRARGNAQQMLDKFKKLAHDAHLNDDRVQEEYYLQFADHYFRVLADQKQRLEDSRPRRDDRPQDGSERSNFDEPRGRDDYAEFDDDGDDEQPRSGADNGPNDGFQSDDYRSSSRDESDGEAGNDFEPAENPFVRDNRDNRESRGPREGARQSRPRREPRRDEEGPARVREPADEQASPVVAGIDASILPPPIGVSADDNAEEAPAKPRRRTRKPRATDGSDEALEVVS